MIKVDSEIGKFTLNDGEFISGNNSIKMLYDIALVLPLKPDEGQTDFAIAARMMQDFKWEILEEDYPTIKGDIVY